MRSYAGWALVAAAFVLGIGAQPQENLPRLTFDVASIRLAKPGNLNGMMKATLGGHGYTVQNIPVKLMISLMYKLPMRQITGGPAWLESDRYDIEARADGTYNLDDLETMLRNLLADRFGLTFHTEMHVGNIYALTIDASGVKMTANPSPQDFDIPITFVGDGVRGKRVSMLYLSWWLGGRLQREERPVVDQTGLTGFYDFTFRFGPVLPPDASREALPPEQANLPSIFDALRDQLGLRLRPAKGPVPFYVIDRVERPSEN